MKKSNTLFLVVAIFLFGFTFQQEKKISLNQLNWLFGKWKLENEKSVTYEIWNKVSDFTFEGVSHTISKSNGDTVFTESLRIVEMSGEIFYIPKVAENEFPIPFKLIKHERDKVTFENPIHDFPQRIIYHLKDSQTLTAIVKGKENRVGKEKFLQFVFKRIE